MTDVEHLRQLQPSIIRAASQVGDDAYIERFLRSHYITPAQERQSRLPWVTVPRLAGSLGAAWLAVSTYFFALEDPTKMDIGLKFLRAAENVILTTAQQAPITTIDPVGIVGRGVAGVIGAGALYMTTEYTLSAVEKRRLKKEKDRRDEREKAETGNIEKVDFTDHTVVVDLQGRSNLNNFRPFFPRSVLLSDKWNPYQNIPEGAVYPSYPVYIKTNRPDDDKVLDRANIYDAASMVFFTQPEESSVFIREEDKAQVRENVSKAIIAIIKAYEMRKATNPFAEDLEVVLIAPEDLPVESNNLFTHANAARFRASIKDILKTKLPEDYVDKHVHIIDSRKLLAEKLAPVREKLIAPLVDETFRADVTRFLTNSGFRIAPDLAHAQIILNYAVSNTDVRIAPLIIQAVRDGHGELIYQNGETLTKHDAVGRLQALERVVTIIDTTGEIEEVYNATSADFEGFLREKIVGILTPQLLRHYRPKSPEPRGKGHKLQELVDSIEQYRGRLPMRLPYPAGYYPEGWVDVNFHTKLSDTDQLFTSAGVVWNRRVIGTNIIPPFHKRLLPSEYMGQPAFVFLYDFGWNTGTESRLLVQKGDVFRRQQQFYILVLEPNSNKLRRVLHGARSFTKSVEEGAPNEDELASTPWKIFNAEDSRNLRETRRVLQYVIQNCLIPITAIT